MNKMLISIAKALFFKDVSEAWKEDKDKPIYLKKRFLGAAGLVLTSLIGGMGYQFDPQTLTKLAESVNLLVIAGIQIVDICKQSWPVVVAIYSTLLGVVGIFDKNSRDQIAKILGEPRPDEPTKPLPEEIKQ